MTAPTSRANHPWARLSLARQLPLLTAAIVAVVMALLLTLTYRALVSTRSEALHGRLEALQRTLVQVSENSARTRGAALRQLANDMALTRALANPSEGAAAADSGVAVALQRFLVPADSGLPVELWTNDGRRIARVGGDPRSDSLETLKPELRSERGTPVNQIPTGVMGTDSVQRGPLYASGGQVLFWNVAPVMHNGARVGFVAQQRRVMPNPVMAKTVRDLSGEEVTVFLRNAGDNFWSSLDGKPASPPARRDTSEDGFIATRAGNQFLGTEGHVRGTPYVFVFEAPQSEIVAQPRATIRQIAMLSFVVLIGAVLVTWLASRRITQPLVALTTAAEAIAHGDHARRVDTSYIMSDEVQRLGTSFNRMATEVEASQHELATQVEEAVATGQELEQTNKHLQEASKAADEARDAALKANRAKSDFLAVMSHELRTPLNAIGGYAEILQIGVYGPVNDKQRDALVRIAKSQQTLLALINDVLNFAKLESGKVRYTISDVPIAPALESLEALIAPQLRDRRMSYAVHPCDGVVARADADKLQQILINLLSNAIKYSSDGGSIDVLCDTSDSEVHVHVRDTGVGIAKDRLNHIFDPFIQVGRALNRPHEGVGLGLSISRDLANAMGGSLSVTSELSKGSTFTLTLERAGNGSAREKG